MLTGKPFDIEIITPEKVEYTGHIESVSLPGALAPFQVLFNHAPIISELEIGVIRFNDSYDNETLYATSGGFVQVLNNKVAIVVETAEDASTIDIQRAIAARKRAEERLAKRSSVDFKRAESSLSRAINRLHVAGLAGQDVSAGLE